MSRMGWERIEELEEQENEDIGVQGRLYFLRVVMVIILGALLFRIYYLQQTKGQNLQALAQENQLAALTTDAPRGVMFDRNGEPLAINLPSYNVTITPAFLPDDDEERQAVFERLSVLTGVPVTNTLQQEALIAEASPELVNSYSRLAQIYGADVQDTLDQAGIVEQLPDSIEGIWLENSFAQYLPAVITSNVPVTLAYTIEQESIFLPGVRLLGPPLGDAQRLPGTLSVLLPGVDGKVLVTRLDLAGLEVSAGSACASGSLEPSHVLRAMGLSDDEARAGLRLSLGRSTTLEDTQQSVDILRTTFVGVDAKHGARAGL